MGWFLWYYTGVMSERTRIKCFWAIACLFLLSQAVYASSQATNAIEYLRVYAIKPACFEYMFTSVMEKSEGRQSLSFNHINGRTVFAGVGDAVGEYRVKSFQPSVERVFNPSVNSYVEKKDGTAILQASDGRKIILDMGKVLTQPGSIACMVWLDSGNWMYVGRNDAVLVGDMEVPVTGISEESVTVMVDNTQCTVPFVSEAEKSSLLSLWADRRKAREEALKVPEKKPVSEESEPRQVVTQVIRHAQPLQPPDNSSRRLVEIRTPPQFFYGTEYRYPVSFETVPVYIRTSSGVRIPQALVVPKLFQSGWSGYGITQTPGGTRITIQR